MSWKKPSQIGGEISKFAYVTAAVLSFLAALITWQMLSYLGIFSERLFPGPLAVAGGLYDAFVRNGWWLDLWVSCYRIILGFLVSAILAVPIGLIMGTFRVVEAIIEPFNGFIRYMPVAAFVPLCILWFGIGDLQKIVIIFIGTYFQLVLMVAYAAAVVPREYVEIHSLMGGTYFRCLFQVIFPSSWPSIYESLRVTVAWAWSYLLVAELVGAQQGVGHKIMQSQRFLQTSSVLGAIIVLGVLGVLTDFALKRLARKLFPWRSAGN